MTVWHSGDRPRSTTVVRSLAHSRLDRLDLVIGPWRGDRHQDHRTTGEVLWQVVRSAPLWAYEIPKHEDDLGHPATFVDLDAELVDAKVRLLAEHFPSQAGRTWFDPELFRGLMRLRGLHGGTRWAEAFHVEKHRL
jgi:LmbE family N-acetylglucosaminyl deacetylase